MYILVTEIKVEKYIMDHFWNILAVLKYVFMHIAKTMPLLTFNSQWKEYRKHRLRLRFIVFNATFNIISAISWRSALLVEETGVSIENHRPVASHWQILSHNVVLSEWGFELTNLVVISTNCISRHKSTIPSRPWRPSKT